MTTHAVIVDVIRTPSGRGKAGGALSGVHPVDLMADVLSSILDRNGLESRQIDDVLIGCVSQVGEQSGNIARNAALAAGFDESVPATTIDRQCGSSQQAATFAAQGVIAGSYDIVIAGGVESMSRAPLGSAAAGGDAYGPRFRARYPRGLVNQGVSAELIAARWGLSRDELDAYAAESHRRAAAATDAGQFEREILPVQPQLQGPDELSRDARSRDALHPDTLRPDALGQDALTRDETIRAATTLEGLAALPPAFATDKMRARYPELDWSITAGNSSPLTDGASAALIMSEERARQLGFTPRARFHSFAVVGDDPLYMLTGPIPATRKILARAQLSFDDLDVYEVNEAFASVPLAWAREFNADPMKLNPRGGAIALGHALGSSGTRLLATLLCELEASGGRYGLQTMCEGGGQANATIIERL